MARTDTLPHFLTDLADAIREKKGSSDTIQASDFDTEIANLPSGGGKYAPQAISFSTFSGTDLEYETANLDTSKLQTMNGMFSSCTNLSKIDISEWNTSNVTNFMQMFSYCQKLQEINASSFDMSKCTNTSNMFQNCTIAQSITFGNTSFSSDITTMQNMFVNCYSLTSIKLPSCTFAQSNVNLSYMFQNGTALQTIDISDFSIGTGTINLNLAFSGCRVLNKIDMRGIDTSKISNFQSMLYRVPTTCLIIVGTDADKTWFATNFSTYTNIKTVAEYEAE